MTNNKGADNAQRDDAFFSKKWEKELGRSSGNDESLHPEWKSVNPHYALTETQYFGFHVPQACIHAFTYLWHHPNLGVISGGTMAMQGIKENSSACELFDYRAYMSDKILPPDLSAYTMDNSYSVQILQGGAAFRTTYQDPTRNNSFDVMHTAVSERLYWPNNKHFEQVMRTKGELVLRGARHCVDGFHIRDRSWGEARMEAPSAVPPNTWNTGVFDEGFAFMVMGFDHPDLNPIWRGLYDVAPEESMRFGWMLVDGESVAIAGMRRIGRYMRPTLIPQSVDMEITDVRGRKFQITGAIVAGTPFYGWPNARTPVCLMRWECGGRVGWGEIQEMQATDFMHALS
jgi:hypothetical protein